MTAVPRIITDNHSLLTHYQELKKGDIVLGRIRLRPGEECLLLGPEGEIIATRRLAHPHVHEQPFTRGLSAVRIPSGFTWVRVRAHDLVHGFGGREVTLSVPHR